MSIFSRVGITLSNFNTITIADDSQNPALTGKPGPADNPGDLSFGQDRVYYENIVGTINSGSINEGIYDSRQDGVNALFEYIRDYSYIPPHTLGLSQTVEQWVNIFDSNGIDANYLPGTLSGEQFTTAISNEIQLDQIANAIMQGEGASNPVSVEWSAASGIVLNLVSASNVNIIDNNSYFGQDATEIDLDSSTSTVEQITGTTPGYMSITASTSIANGQLIFSQNSITNTAQLASSISDLGVTLGGIDLVSLYGLGNGSTIVAGSNNQFTLSTSGGGLVIGEVGGVPQTINLPSGFLANPTSGPLTTLSGAADVVIVNGNNQTITGSVAGEIMIATGSGDVLNAGTTGNVLIDLTGATGNYDLYPSYADDNDLGPGFFDGTPTSGGVTEIVQSDAAGSIATNNTFWSAFGDSLFIGDAGNNTFNLGSGYLTTNIIYGGGGTSQYNIGGTIDILYTAAAPTPQELENLSVSLFDEGFNSTTATTYIIDPGPNDKINNFEGDYAATQIFSAYGASVVIGQDEWDNVFTGNGLGDAINLGDGTIGIGDVGHWNGTPFDYQLYQNGGLTIENFVNGDFGISFSGDAEKFPLIYNTVNTVPDGTPPASAYGDIAGDIYSYNEKEYVNIGGSGGTMTNGFNDLGPGDEATGVNIASDGFMDVLSGGSTSGDIVQSGGTEMVFSGGTATGTTVSSGGILIDLAGTITQSVVQAGGQVVSTGLVVSQSTGLSFYPSAANGLTLTSGTTEYVLAGGTAINTTVSSGTQIVLSGGIAIGTMLSSGGTQTVSSGGTANATAVNWGGEEFVASGIDSGSYVLYGGQETVLAGGSAIATEISSGGNEIVSSGGTTKYAVVSSGGVEAVSSGGATLGTTVQSGGAEIVWSGGSATSTTVNSGGTLIVFPGGHATGANILAGGQVLSTGVVFSQTLWGVAAYPSMVSGLGLGIGGYAYVFAGGIASSTTLYENGEQFVLSGGIASNVADVGGLETVLSGGIGSGGLVSSGGAVAVSSGGTIFGLTLGNFGNLYVYSGGTTSGTDVAGFGTEWISGGVAYGTTVSYGGTENVYLGGTVSGAILSSGGTGEIDAGGTAIGTTIDSGAGEVLELVNDVFGNPATLTTSIGGFAYNAEIWGSEYVYSASYDFGGAVNSGGVLDVFTGGYASATTVFGGGTLVASGGTAINAFVYAGGVENLSSGGSSYLGTIDGTENVFTGASAGDGTVSGIGVITVYSGGLASGTTILGGGNLTLSAGMSTSAIVGSGGVAQISSGGSASWTAVNAGGQDVVYAGGTATGTVLTNNGNEFAYGKTVSAVVSSGGTETINSSGSSVGAILMAGGRELVSSGGTISGATIAGGTLIVSSGGTVTGNIAFVGSGGKLALAGNPPSGATVSGFGIGEQIDLTSIAYVSGAAASVNSSTDKLILTDGGNTYLLQLTGTFTNSAFVAASDGTSGTDITVTSAGSSGGVVLYTPSSGSSYLGTIASNTSVSNGATEYVYNAGIAVSTHVSSGGSQIVYAGGAASSTSDVGGQVILSGGTASGISVSNGGVNGVVIYSGGIASGGSVFAGTNENVSSGGKAIGVTISGAGLEVTTGGVASNSILISGSHLDVSGGTVSGTSVGISSTENLSAGASAISSFVNSGGTENVLSGGTGTSATISSGGIQAISAGGTANLTSLKTGTETVYAGGTATSTSDVGGQIIVSGGTAIGLTVSNGGANGVVVYSGGVASGGNVLAGTNENISSGGRAIGVMINGAGLEVTAGGVASNSVLVSGSHLDVTSGTVSGTSVGLSSTENLSASANASGSVVISGGSENVLSGGTATSTTVSSGGKQVVSSGGKVNGTTISGGGSEIVQSGATMSGSIDFAGSSGTLSLGGTVLPTNVISGFDAATVTTDDIVLTSYTYSSSDSATLGSSNVLTLHLNGTISTLDFNTSQSFAGEYFAVQKNSQNQVVIVDPPISGSASWFGNDNKSLGSARYATDITSPFANTPTQMPFLANSGSVEQPKGLWDILNRSDLRHMNISSFIAPHLSGSEESEHESVRSLPLSGHFAGVAATDISNQLLRNGTQHPIIIHSGFV